MRLSAIVGTIMLAGIHSGCSDSNPTSPTNPAAGETVYTVPTAEGTAPITFSFNFKSFKPARGSQLVVGQEIHVVVRCSKPAGWEMVARLRGSAGPGTPAIAVSTFDTRGARDFSTNQRRDNLFVGSCADHDQGTAYAITAQEPDIPFIRLEVWAMQTASMPGRWVEGTEAGFGWPVGPSGTGREPLVVYERVDWRRP